MSERTILLDVFAANQKRERLIEQALAETDLPPEDYPLYVFIGVEGPLTPTKLARELGMPLSTVLFRVRRLQRRRHAERIPNPEDRRSLSTPAHSGRAGASRMGPPALPGTCARGGGAPG